MSEINSTQRKYLRGLAHSLKPVIQVGQKGITDELISSVDEALNAHELIKVKFVEFKGERKELTDEIAKKCSAQLAGMIGNIAILYREHKNEDKRKIKLP